MSPGQQPFITEPEYYADLGYKGFEHWYQPQSENIAATWVDRRLKDNNKYYR